MLAAAAGALVAAPAGAKPTGLAPEPTPIEVRARRLSGFKPSDPGLRRFGPLEWVGGLELSSDERAFGGLSGLALDPDGRGLLAVSDAGIWLQARLDTEGEVPVGLSNAVLCPMRGHEGRIIQGQPWGDAECLAVRDGFAFVGVEAANRVLRYRRADGLTATPTLVEVPEEVRQLHRGRGLEAIVAHPSSGPNAGALLLIAERASREEPDIRCWLVGGPNPGRLRLAPEGFDATDAALLPGGDVLLLERRFQPPFGLWCRLRRLSSADLRPGRRVEGTVLIEVGTDHAIDNMEAIAVHRGADGATYVTLMSDDNYNILQRTLLLRFRLVG